MSNGNIITVTYSSNMTQGIRLLKGRYDIYYNASDSIRTDVCIVTIYVLGSSYRNVDYCKNDKYHIEVFLIIIIIY